MAIGKFHGVMMPTTPTGSRVTSTSTPGRVEAIFSPASRSTSPAKKSKIWPARATSPIALGQRLALFARQQPAELVLARHDLVGDLRQNVVALLDAGPRPCRERGTGRADGVLGLLPRSARIAADDVAGIGRIDIVGGLLAIDPASGDKILMHGHTVAIPDFSIERLDMRSLVPGSGRWTDGACVAVI